MYSFLASLIYIFTDFFFCFKLLLLFLQMDSNKQELNNTVLLNKSTLIFFYFRPLPLPQPPAKKSELLKCYYGSFAAKARKCLK